jgi:glycosyltransferase involved in cell wall biosynthesis
VTHPKITIVTPSYNQGRFLEQTIASVVEQNYSNLEYIVIDGGSTDGSVDIIKRHKDRFAYWISEKDNGQSDAINKGLRRSTGEILAWLNSDDCYLPGTLENVAKYFDSRPDVDFLYGDLILVDEGGSPVGIRRVVPYNYTLALYGLSSIPQPSTFFRRRALDTVGLIDPEYHYHMDTEFFLRFGKAGLKAAYLPFPLAKFRLHRGSKTISRNVDRNAESQRVLERMLERKISKNEMRIFRGLRLVAQMVMYVQRLFLRWDVLPFRARFAMRKARR